MYIFKRIADLRQYLKSATGSVGFVPTMGALHQGHISLIEHSVAENPITICSIFINPTQFNDPNDFEKYPITLSRDIEKLTRTGVNALFLPSVAEIYPAGIQHIPQYPIGYLDTVLEGEKRPGHFNGVCAVMQKLLEATSPNKLYMGEKDFQQCLVVKWLLHYLKSPIQLITCATLRENGILAMSSRNERLSAEGRAQAHLIYQSLSNIKQEQSHQSFTSLQQSTLNTLHQAGFDTEYLLLANADNLELLSDFTTNKPMVVLIATRLEGIRLIDNLRL
jgi:pantoate--beta-alanine ligase